MIDYIKNSSLSESSEKKHNTYLNKWVELTPTKSIQYIVLFPAHSLTLLEKYLKQKDYSNKYFAPQNSTIQFDNSFHKMVNTFISSNSSKCVFFIYGQNDPWALQTKAAKNVFIVPAGSHKSRIIDFSAEQQADIYNKIRTRIK